MSSRDFSEKISEWAEDKLKEQWQHQLLRQLAQGEFLTEKMIADTAKKAVQASYPADSLWFNPPAATEDSGSQRLSADDFGIRTLSGEPVKLQQIEHVSGVNRLKEGIVLDFNPEVITVIFGSNGSGKSGYTRILKKFAASRAQEEILPNALSPDSNSASATITYKQGEKVESVTWRQGQVSVDSSFQRVRVFDSKSAQTHIQDAREVAYVPPQIEVLTRFIESLMEVKSCIENMQSNLGSDSFDPIGELEERFIDLVNRLGTPEAKRQIEQIEDFTDTQEEALQTLEKNLGQLQADSPARLVQRITSRIEAIVKFESGFEEPDRAFQNINAIKANRTRLRLDNATNESEQLKDSLGNVDRLQVTVSRDWPSLWEAAQGFFMSLSEDHDSRHSAVAEWQACPVCQQDLSESAKERLLQFEQFATSEASAKLRSAKKAYQDFETIISGILLVSDDEAAKQVKTLVDQLELDECDADKLKRQYASYCQAMTNEVEYLKRVLEGSENLPESSNERDTNEKSSSVTRETYDQTAAALKLTLSTIKDHLKNERTRLNSIKDDETGQASLATDIQELKYLKLLAEYKDRLRSLHDARLQSNAHKQAIDNCKPTRVTNLVKKLSDDFISSISTRFGEELLRLGFENSMPVELVLDKTQKGISYIRTQVNSDCSNNVQEILSEGEQRIASLAGFFADLTGSEDKSCLIFDDPVSSLDHRFREKVATRLVEESIDRQVVVFSHDYAFVRLLEQSLANLNRKRISGGEDPLPNLDEKEIFRTSEGAGDLSPVEWRRRNLKSQIGVLKDQLQKVEVLERKHPDEYPLAAQNLLGAVRETWERVVEENLLNGVVVRLDRAVHTQKLRVIADISEADLATVELGMTNTSQLMQGHSDAGEIASERFPEATKIREEVERLVDFDKDVRKRRK